MKKIIAVLLVIVLAFSFVACGDNTGKPMDPKVVDQKVESGELGSIIGHYSVKNAENKGFYIQFNSALESFDYYDKDGTLVVFQGDEVVYDKDGNKVDKSELQYGQALLIAFDGEAYDTDPVTIKAYKVTLAN